MDKGARNVEILKQNEWDPFPVENQIAIIYAGTKGLLGNVPIGQVKAFEKEFINYMNANHKDVMNTLESGKYGDDSKSVLEKVALELASKY